MAPIGVSVTCNSNCNKWCPRVVKIFCCCFKCTNDDDAEEPEEVTKVKNIAFSNIIDTID
jgi:hypothetical protein